MGGVVLKLHLRRMGPALKSLNFLILEFETMLPNSELRGRKNIICFERDVMSNALHQLHTMRIPPLSTYGLVELTDALNQLST